MVVAWYPAWLWVLLVALLNLLIPATEFQSKDCMQVLKSNYVSEDNILLI
jgi:hypothetical protein